jgi:hypothetical protein
MRTTLALDEDVLEMAKHFAASHLLSLDEAVSELVRRGARLEPRLVEKNGMLVVARTANAPPYQCGS